MEDVFDPNSDIIVNTIRIVSTREKSPYKSTPAALTMRIESISEKPDESAREPT